MVIKKLRARFARYGPDERRRAPGARSFRGAQAASLFISAACRDAFPNLFTRTSIGMSLRVAGKLPATTGWQPVLPGIPKRK